MSKKNRGGRKGRPKKTKARQRRRATQTQKPFEQDRKRRIGPFGETGKPPRMQ